VLRRQNLVKYPLLKSPWTNLDVLALKTWGKRLGQFVCLFSVGDNQSIQVARASNLELCLSISLSDLDQFGIRSAGLLKEVTDIGNLLRHDETEI
jgi:hypothetical protein